MSIKIKDLNINLANRIISSPMAALTLSITEEVKISFVLQNSSHYTINHYYALNLSTFSDAKFTKRPIDVGQVWVVWISGAGPLSLTIIPPLSLKSQVFDFDAVFMSNTEILISISFLMVQDLFDFINTDEVLNGGPNNGFNPLDSNANQLIKASLSGPTLLNGSGSHVYSGTRWLNLFAYDADPVTFQPLGAGTTSFATWEFGLAGEINAYFPVQARFFDRGLLNQQGFFTALDVPNFGALMRFEAETPNGQTGLLVQRKLGGAFDDVDANFDTLINNGGFWNNGTHVVRFRVNRGFTNVLNPREVSLCRASIIETDPNAVTNLQNVGAAVRYDTLLATNILTPAPNFVSSLGGIGTPFLFSETSNVLSFECRVNGAVLASYSQPRIVLHLFTSDGVNDSVHISPVLAVSPQPPSLTGVTGVLQTYNDQFTGNELSVSPLERFRAIVAIDATTFSFGSATFAQLLSGVRVTYRLRPLPIFAPNGAIDVQGFWSAANNQSTGNANLLVTVSGADYELQADFRAFNNFLSGPLDYEVFWEIILNNQGNLMIYTYLQKIRVRTFDATRLVGLRFLDEDTNSQRFFICRESDGILVEVQKDGPPNMNLIAVGINTQSLTFQNFSQYQLSNVFEQAAYLSPYLPALSSPLFSQVPVDFAANFATYRLRTALLPSVLANAGNLFFGVLCYEPPLAQFNPNDLGADLLLWLDPNSLNAARVWRLHGETVPLTQGTTAFTFIPSAARVYLIGMLLSFDGGVSSYEIIDVVGSTVTLNTSILEVTGSYVVSVAAVTTWPDLSSFARSVTSPANNAPYFLRNALGLRNVTYMLAPWYWNVSPITNSEPLSLNCIMVKRIDAARTTTDVLFSHRSAVNNLIQFRDTSTQARSSTTVLISASTTSGYTPPPSYSIVTNIFKQNTSPMLDVYQVWNNGNEANRSSVTVNGASYSAALQTLGAFNNGTYHAAYAGEVAMVFLFGDLPLIDVQKLEGYAAWEFGIQGQLPLSHPYRNIRP